MDQRGELAASLLISRHAAQDAESRRKSLRGGQNQNLILCFFFVTLCASVPLREKSF